MEQQIEFAGEVGFHVVLFDVICGLSEMLVLLLLVALRFLVLALQKHQFKHQRLLTGVCRSFDQLLYPSQRDNYLRQPLSLDLALCQEKVDHMQI